ncbi:MAG: hypothetical protein NVS4B7_17750 [Ktedonobacteraceae bacterium]
MPMLNIQLFGKFCVRRGEQLLEGFDARKVQELFCYLLLHRDHSLPRETLASILWPDTTTVQSKKSLRQALWQLQSVLGSHNASVEERVLLVEPDWIRLNSEADLRLDTAVLENAFQLVQKIPGHELDIQQAQMLQSVVQLYHGPLLEGWYQDWCLYERERLQSMYLAMLDKLMGYCEVYRDYETGLLYGMRIMCYDRARERTHRRLMRLHYLNGDRTAALRQFEQCTDALDEELGVGPSKPTIALYAQIQADQLEGPVPILVSNETTAAITKTLAVTSPPLLEILGRLEHLQGALVDLQQQVQQSMKAVEHLLS